MREYLGMMPRPLSGPARCQLVRSCEPQAASVMSLAGTDAACRARCPAASKATPGFPWAGGM